MSATRPQLVPTPSESDLPEGWELARLREICAPPQYGWTTSANKDKRGIRFLRTSDISDGEVHWASVPGCADEPDNPEKYLLHAGDILISRAGSVGVSYLVRECPRTVFASYLIRFRALPPIQPAYVAFFLKSPSYWSAIAEEAAGIAIPNVNASKLKEIEVPLAPLAEQKRIVEKVEQLLAHVNAARERLARVPAVLEHLRKAVLAAACSGRLTADWRATRRSDGDEWETTTLTEIGETRLGKMLDKAKNVGSPTPYLRNLNVRWFSFDISELARMRATPEDRTELNIRDGDLLVCEGGEPGRCAVWNLGSTGIIFQKAIHRIRLANRVIPQWVALNLKNDANSGALEDYFTGSTIKHLTGRSLESYVFPIPLVEEQREIVRRAEALFNLADTIEKRVAGATARADKLAQAILAKAFRGELVPTEAELARREGRDYEPASVLPERIRAERQDKQFAGAAACRPVRLHRAR